MIKYYYFEKFLEKFFDMDFAQQLRMMGKCGKSAYNVNGEDTNDIPAQAIKGRVSPAGKTFSGMINFENNKIRIDCAEELSFWLEIDFNKCPFFAAAPGGIEANAAEREFNHKKRRRL
jgi:hypothetical protein